MIKSIVQKNLRDFYEDIRIVFSTFGDLLPIVAA